MFVPSWLWFCAKSFLFVLSRYVVHNCFSTIMLPSLQLCRKRIALFWVSHSILTGMHSSGKYLIACSMYQRIRIVSSILHFMYNQLYISCSFVKLSARLMMLISLCTFLPKIPWNLSFRYVLFHKKKTPNDAVTPQRQSQFTPKMKANTEPRLLSSLVWSLFFMK